jgi:hypothetical protein
MSDQFTLSVDYKGEERQYTADLLIQGFTHKFRVLIDGVEVFFEPDEEGHYRAIKMPWQEERQFTKTDIGLLGEIQQKIEAILV